MSEPVVQIIKVKELLKKKDLTIPAYQRPYKWGVKNVSQLVDDILAHRHRSAYRLGTIVLHQNNNRLDIVDGQQRTVSLVLLDLAISSSNKKSVEIKTDLASQLKFSNPVSINNIRNNYKELSRRVEDFDKASVEFFYEKCELVVVVLNNVSEAFQFFDSQNARGKDLLPHDLLKAFHLREMSGVSEEDEMRACVSSWENVESDQLKELFGNYLYRIRNWSKGCSARYFTKKDVDIFKGISPHAEESFPYARLYLISHFYVDGYNKEYHRRIDRQVMNYPFQVDQVIINGKRFFEMISHYVNKLMNKEYLKQYIPNDSGMAGQILKVLDSDEYKGKNRTGDKYVRTLFDCAVIYYLDKFGPAEIKRAIEKFFLWAYQLRLKQFSVQLASIDNYALESPFVFKTIRDAVHPKDVLSIQIPVVKNVDSTKTEPIEKLFRELNYLPAEKNKK